MNFLPHMSPVSWIELFVLVSLILFMVVLVINFLYFTDTHQESEIKGSVVKSLVWVW